MVSPRELVVDVSSMVNVLVVVVSRDCTWGVVVSPGVLLVVVASPDDSSVVELMVVVVSRDCTWGVVVSPGVLLVVVSPDDSSVLNCWS